jgi:hypothetical protein
MSLRDTIPTYVPCFTPYIKVQDDGLVVLTLPDIHGVMVNVELSAAKFGSLAKDVGAVYGVMATRTAGAVEASNASLVTTARGP